ncbi:MAG TPA: DUF6510 family protein [Hyphomicrobiaceae bacterium]|jgi:hypothetical protein|nr:DUF6510 family protein [Hyphomicrobiaceae bacterium]
MSLQAGDLPGLDGNAAAGLLRELFALDVTVARFTCAGCGSVGELGGARVYGGAMGAIFRCTGCDGVVLRLVRTPAGLWLDMQGTRRMVVPAAPD